MKIEWRRGTETKDITEYVESASWEGTDTQTSRTATIVTAYDYYRKVYLNIKLGDLIYLYEEKNIFVGVVTYAERSGEIGTVSYTAKDFMHYLVRSKGTYKFKNTTPEKITKKICDDLLIQTTNVYKTKTHVRSLLFENDETYYGIIVTAYNEASKKMSAKYPPVFMPIMKKNKLSVIVKGQRSGITLKSNNDITASSYSQNTDEMVTSVIIINDKGKKTGAVTNRKRQNKYGVYQEIYKKEKGTNAKTAAKQLLYGITKEANIESVGYVQCIAGYSVNIEDEATGMTGRFYIKSDKHTWKDGIHTMSLTLKFSNELEEV